MTDQKTEEHTEFLEALTQLRGYYPAPLGQAKPVHWHAPGILIHKGVSCIAGEAEAGKTTLALQLTESLLFTGDFLGVPVSTVRRVLWVELDEDRAMLYEQAQKMGMVSTPYIAVWDRVSWNRETGELTNLYYVLLNYQPEVLIIDALGSLGVEENSNTEVSRLYQNLRCLAREFNLSVLLLHHLTKLQLRDTRSLKTRIRGAGDIVNRADAVLGMERAEDSNLVHLSQIKLRGRDRLELDVRQDPQTLIYERIKGRNVFISDRISQLEDRAETIRAVHEIYGIKKPAAARAYDRERRRLITEGKSKLKSQQKERQK